MPPKKRARLKFNPSKTFVVTASTKPKQVPKNVEVARVDASVRTLPRGLFRDCESLDEVIFEEGTHTIGKGAFCNCTTLTKVQFPTTLRKILEEAFFQCPKLSSIDLPLGLKVIEEHAFRLTGLCQLEIPATVETIERGAFEDCLEMETCVLPPRLEYIPDFLFSNCEQLSEVEFPSTLESIGSHAFWGCRALELLDLSHCIHCESIWEDAFQMCIGMSILHLPPNLELIDVRAFSGCKSLTHVRIPPKVERGGLINWGRHNPFGACTSLVSVEIPEGMPSISLIPHGEIEGIEDCYALINVYLPPSQEVYIPEPDDFGDEDDASIYPQATIDWESLIAKLRHRFKGLPLHQVCYFHSYYPVKETVQKIRKILKENPNAANEVDTLGMTPLHILSLAQKPVIALLQELPNISKMALSSKDIFGSFPLVYLGRNPLREGSDATRWMIQTIVENRLPFLGLDRWRQELQEAKASCDRQLDDDDDDHRSEASDTSSESDAVLPLFDVLARFEFLEVLSLMEIALWRIKLKDNMMMLMMVEENATEEHQIDRESCRVQCGMSLVVANVLPFLGK